MNNCGHLSSRLDGIDCEECGFLCCRRCIREENLCEGCKNEDMNKNARIFQFDPNSQKCKRCNKTCKMISSERIEKKPTIFHWMFLFLIGLGGGLSGDDGNRVYYKTYHKCRKCNLEFYKEVNNLKSKYIGKVNDYNPNSYYNNITE